METKIEIGIWRIRRYEERKNMNADFRIDGKVIETKRLILRSFKQTDLEDFYEYASVEGVGEMAGWKHHENIAESQSIMNSFISEDKVFAICLKKNNKVIGTVGALQYEVIQYRLEHEYSAKATYEPFSVHKACWVEVENDKSEEFLEFKRVKQRYLARDKYNQLVFLADSAFTIQMTQEKFPSVKLHFVSEF